MAIALVFIVFLTLFAGGGYANEPSLIAAGGSFAVFGGFGLLPRLRTVLRTWKGLSTASLLFSVVVIVTLVQIASPRALDRGQSLIDLLRLLGSGAVFLTAVAVGRSPRALKMLTASLNVAGLMFVVAALSLYVLHPHAPKALDGGRLEAFFPTSPNTAAATIGLIAIMALGRLLSGLRRGPKGVQIGERIEQSLGKVWLEILTLGFAVVALGMTGSRSGVLLVGLCALGLVVWGGLKGGSESRQTASVWAFGLPGLMAAFAVGAGVTLARFPAIGSDAWSRTQVYQAHWPLVFEHPLIGHGLGSFVVLNRRIITPDNFIALSWIADFHNVVLQWIEEMGVIGAGAMFACVGSIVLVIVRGANRIDTSRTWLKTVALASLFLILQGLVDIALQYEGVVMLWAVLLGSAFGLATGESHRRSRDSAT